MDVKTWELNIIFNSNNLQLIIFVILFNQLNFLFFNLFIKLLKLKVLYIFKLKFLNML